MTTEAESFDEWGNKIGERVYVRIWKNQKREILMVLNKAGDLPNGDKRDTGWGLPGGGIKDGETPEAAAYREAAEEVGDKMAEALKGKLKCIKSIKRWVRDRDGRPIEGGDYILHHIFEAELDQDVPLGCGNDPVKIVVEARWLEPWDISKVGYADAQSYVEKNRKGEDVRTFRIYKAAVRAIESRE